MGNWLWLLLNLMAFQYSLEKAETAMPAATLSPPEGNTTFLGGTTWCVARPGVSQVELQVALDWACGLGKADCSPIQKGGPCFEPETLVSHASYAFNSYYQQNGNSDIACFFGGTALLTQTNPSEKGYEKCAFLTSESLNSSSVIRLSCAIWWKVIHVVLLLIVIMEL